MKAIERDFLEQVKDYANNNILEVENTFPKAMELVMNTLLEHKIHPAVWVAVGQTLSDEGAYRLIASLRSEE